MNLFVHTTAHKTAELANTIIKSNHIRFTSFPIGLDSDNSPKDTHTTPRTKVRRKTFDPTVLAIKTPAWALRPALYATSFSGSVVAIERIVRPAVDWEMWSRPASVEVVEASRIPARDRAAADKTKKTI